MPNFAVRWPNGQLSIVYASSKEDAAVRLDEWAPVEPRYVERLPEFMATFGLNSDGHLQVEELGYECWNLIMEKYYPILSEFTGEHCMEDSSEAGYKLGLQQAIEAEAKRVEGFERVLVKGAELLQAATDASGAYARDIMRSLAQEKKTTS